MHVDELISDFNELFLDMANFIASISQDSIIGRNIGDIRKVFSNINQKNKAKFIDSFVYKILKYKKAIDNNDEKFFFVEIEKDEVKGDPDLKGINIFDLKLVWCKFDSNNKIIIFDYLKSLCNIANMYILL